MGLDLGTRLGKIRLKNPVLAASGTFGHAREFEPYMDLKALGGIVTKTITLKPRLGNPPPRIVETPSGMLNAIGLQNPGAEGFIEKKLPFLRKINIPILVSVMGYSVEEFTAVTRKIDKAAGVDGFELNLSCPNVAYGSRAANVYEASRMFAHDEGMIGEVVSAVRRATKKTLIAKLGPDVSNIGQMARAAEQSGADAVSLVNTFVAMAIDPRTRRPVLANKTGGLSGPCIRPIAVRLVWEAAKAVRIPVIGMGGIVEAGHALEFIVAGASAVQIGTANFVNPRASLDILDGIRKFMKQEKIRKLEELIGSVRV